MKLSELTDPGAVVAAMHEFDELGRDRFLEKYGFGRARTYVVEHRGRTYDSKALAAAAYGHQHGEPLRADMFSGGLNTVAQKLTSLGFTVVGEDRVPLLPPSTSTFVLLWNPSSWEWSQDDRDRMQQLIAEQGQAPDRWSTGSRTSGVHPGDRIFLLKVGTRPLGMVASGTALSKIEYADHWDEEQQKQAPFVDVVWDTLLDPQDVLPREVLKEEIPDNGWTFQGGGVLLAADVADDLELLWASHRPVEQVASAIEARYAPGLSRRRLHQQAFRRLLLQHYPAECAVCGLQEMSILEAAHIFPDSKGGPSDVANGRLLCPNHHRALDAGLYELTDAGPVWKDSTRAF
ncbi:HNH endonuclease [Kocuria sp. NPDC057446]|uniref:HNH endonuclease n=1 Tax=Kocuria sp. NPDC057446 TaxID=3346137 RepID=UPI00369020A3